MPHYPNAFYRVSVKVIIRNEAGHVLLVKEHIDDWVLPGGGVDHGETEDEALKRELQEEIGATNIMSRRLLAVHTFYARTEGVWYMWLLYAVEVESHDVNLASDTSEVRFIDIKGFKDSTNRREKIIYDVVSLADAR